MSDPLAIPAGQSVLTAQPGRTPLSGRNTAAQQWADAYAYQHFLDRAGRAPTQAELDQLAPNFYQGQDPNLGNLGVLDQAISQYISQQQNTPQNIYDQQQKQVQDAYTSQQGTIDPQTKSTFQSLLGRDPSNAELQHFGMLIASGQDPYQVQQALQSTQEYQNAQLAKTTKANDLENQQFVGGLGSQLQATNADYYSKYILPSIQANASASGRSFDSSGVSSQMANAGQQQNNQLQDYLAQVSANLRGSNVASQYGQQGAAQANAYGQYQQLLNQQYGLQNAGVSNQLANNAANTQYSQNLNMYQMQQQAYNNYLNNYGKRSGSQGIGSAVGGVLGGATGAYFSGPTGAAAGYQMGSGAGGAIGAYF